MDLDLIFKLAGVGVLLFIVDELLGVCGKGNYAKVANIVGVVIMLGIVLSKIIDLFAEVKTMFMF